MGRVFLMKINSESSDWKCWLDSNEMVMENTMELCRCWYATCWICLTEMRASMRHYRSPSFITWRRVTVASEPSVNWRAFYALEVASSSPSGLKSNAIERYSSSIDTVRFQKSSLGMGHLSKHWDTKGRSVEVGGFSKHSIDSMRNLCTYTYILENSIKLNSLSFFTVWLVSGCSNKVCNLMRSGNISWAVPSNRNFFEKWSNRSGIPGSWC